MALTIDHLQQAHERAAHLAFTGDLDSDGGGIARRALRSLIAAGRVDISVNLDGVGFLDSAGLAALIASLRLARERGGEVRVETSNARIRRILEITSLGKVFKLQQTDRAA